MASISKIQTTKDGRRFWLIQVSMGKGQSLRKSRFYWPEGKNGFPVAESTATRERDRFAAEFERQCKAGEVLSRKEKAEQEAARQAELAKIKTVKQYAENVFLPAKDVTVTENTKANYRMYFNKHIFPAEVLNREEMAKQKAVIKFGDMLLTDVTPAMITKLLLDYQAAGHSHGSCIKLYNILNGLFEMAFLDDSVPLSPMLKVKRPAASKDASTKPETEKALTAQEADYLLSCIDSEYLEALEHHKAGFDKDRKKVYAALLWKVFIALSVDTGCRRGELCGLQWSDIDWKKKSITISRNLQYTAQKGVYVAMPKNGKTRAVDIGDDSAALLKLLQDEQSQHHLSPWVFSQEGTNEPIHPQSPTRFFKKFGERHNIPEFHPHLLRHSAASIAITHGADVVSVSQRLGHSDTAVTLRMYAHANEESIRKAGQTMRQAIKDARKGSKKPAAE